MSDLAQVRKKLSKVKYDMMSGKLNKKCRFFSALFSHMKIRVVDSPEITTAGTDGISVYFSADFIRDMPIDELVGLSMHELGHVIYQHIPISQELNLDPKLQNIAGDHYINLWLLKHGFKLPGFASTKPNDGGYYADPKYTDWSTMRIYRDLEKNPPDQDELDQFQIDCLSPEELDEDGNPNPNAPSPGSSEASAIQQKVKANITKAATTVLLTGGWSDVPSDIQLAIKKMNNPKLPWNKILAKYMTAYQKNDFSMQRPNRRYIPNELYLPSLHNPGIGGTMFACDVSGSMYGTPIDKVFAEVKDFFKKYKPEYLHLLSFDTRIQMNEKFHPGQSLDRLKITGGGGTNVTPILELIRKERPKFALIMTDGDFAKPDMQGIRSDIIWVIVDQDSWKAPRARDRVIIVKDD